MDKDKKMLDLMKAWKRMGESLVSRTPIEGPIMVEQSEITDSILVDANLNSNETRENQTTYKVVMNDLLQNWPTIKSTIDQTQIKDIIEDALPKYLLNTYNAPIESFTWKFIK